jgi:hypothetical protein
MIEQIIVSALAGIIYGYSFASQQGSIFSSSDSKMSAQLRSLLFFIMRIATLALLFRYLLRMPKISSILILSPFLIAFWLVIMSMKVIRHERTGTHHR